MYYLFFLRSLSLLVATGLLSAQTVSAQPGARLSLPQEASINLPSQPVGPSDLIVVSIYNQPALSRTVRVSTDGQIRLPMLKQRIAAAGKLPSDLEEAIASAYQSESILVDPQVTVNIADYHSHPIQVGGAVRRPLTFQAEGPTTLLEAINRAEGLTDSAGPDVLVTKSDIGPDGKKGIPVTRRIMAKALFESGDSAANIVLTGGEEVRIPEAGRVFVVGNVKKPCNFPIKQGESTVLQALTYSEGLLRYSTKQAYIYRREADGQKNEIAVELKQIMERKIPDVKLLPDDILYVPENEKKRMSMAALTAMFTIAGGSVAYALIVTH